MTGGTHPYDAIPTCSGGTTLSYTAPQASDNPFLSPPARDVSNPFLSSPTLPPAPNPFGLPPPAPSSSGGPFAAFSRKQSARQPPPPPKPAGFGASIANGGPAPVATKPPPVELAPKLELAIMDPGLDDEALRDLAYYVFMSCLSQSPPGMGSKPQQGITSHQQQQKLALATTIREQLGMPDVIAKSIDGLLPLLTKGSSDWNTRRLCSMEGLASLVKLARPQHFEAAVSSSTTPITPQRSSNSSASRMMESIMHPGRASSSSSANAGSPVKSGDSPSSFTAGDKSIDSFEAFVRWRRSMGAVLHAAGHTAVAAWNIRQKKDQALPVDGDPSSREPVKGAQQAQAARKVLSRLCGALRRMDVLQEVEMDEEEYTEAVAAAMGATSALALLPVPPPPVPRDDAHTHVGWAFPWALRARIAEKLLFAVFASLESSVYINDAIPLTSYLDGVVFQTLGISESLSLSLNAWVHFRQYIVTSDISLSRQIKHMLTKLGAGAPLAGPGAVASLSADEQVTAEVRRVSVFHIRQRLSDYHLKFPHGKEGEMQAMIDVLAFAQRLSVDEGDVGAIVTEIARESACAQFERLMAPRISTAPSAEQSLLDAINIAKVVMLAEERVYAPILAQHYPQQAARPVMAGCVAEIGTRQHLAETASAIHAALGRQLLMPWIKTGLKLDPMVANVFSAALKLDTEVAKLVAAAIDNPSTVQATISKGDAETLATFAKWPLTEPLKVVTVDWASLQVERLNTWVTRSVQQEKWVAVNNQDGCAQSAVEILKLVQDSLDSLYALGLPLRFEGRLGALDVLMNGVDTMMEIFSQAILSKIGCVARLVPATPPVTRYKKEVASKQEHAEASLLANASTVPPIKKAPPRMRIPGTKGWSSSGNPNTITLLDLLATINFKPGKSPVGVFLESVPRVGTSPDYAVIHKQLTNPVVICCISSAQFLLNHVDTIACAAYKHLEVDGATIPAAKPTGESKPVFLAPAREALMKALTHSCNFLCCKAVYWDMRSAWCEHLYRHRVTGGAPFSTNLEPLLDGLNQVLADVGSQMPDNTRAFFAAELLKVVCEAYNRVLLDGGPCRWFSPSDVPALEADLKQLALLFQAEGEGLAKPVVKDIMSSTYRVLDLVRMDLPVLMEALKTARKDNAASGGAPSNNKVMRKLKPGGMQVPLNSSMRHDQSMTGAEDINPAVLFSEGELMRALARRPERTGSKLLKEKYSIPISIK